MRIVHFVPWSFLSVDDGGRIRTAAVATALARCGELHVVDLDRRAVVKPSPAGETVPLPFGGEATYWSCVPGEAPWHRWLRRNALLRRAAGRAVARRLSPRVAVADDLRCASVALACGAGRVILGTHNVESELHRELARHLPAEGGRHAREAAAFARAEARLLPRGDEVWGVRAADAEHYLRLGAKGARVVPNVVPDSAFAAPSVGTPGVGVFFGSLWWGPNSAAVDSLVAMALRLSPCFPPGYPPLRLVVAGRGAGGELLGRIGRARPLVEAVGFVPDLKGLVRRTAAVILPIGWGGGTKVKVIEALALGKPVVTTPEGAAGLDLRDGVHARVVPKGDGFDRAVLEVLGRPADFLEMAAAGQRHVRERFSQGAMDRIVAEALSAPAV